MKNKNLVVRTLFKGSLMGIADAIPGVSGATIALILGIYEQLIHSISFFFSNISNPRELLKSKELRFLVNLYFGVFITFYIFLKIIQDLLTNNEVQLFSYFIGLILASIFVILSRNKEIALKKLHFMILGFLAGVLLLSINTITQNHSTAMIFISGIAAISAMILPGISGAYVLLMLNQYDFIANALVNLNSKIVLIFALGVILGVFFMSKILNWLLKRHHDSTLTFLIGLMIGGLRTPFQRINGNYKSLVIFGFLGIATVVLINFLQREKEKKLKKR